jgi:hypothetical protein
MLWKALNPICSTLNPRLNVNDYKKDIKFDFIKGDIDINEWVYGFNGFVQRFVSTLLTNETPIIKYGLFELLPKSSNQVEFDKECETLANAIVSHKHSDSTIQNPNGLGHTVEEIYSMSNEKIDDIYYLLVETKVTGIDDNVTVKVPLKHVRDNMQEKPV